MINARSGCVSILYGKDAIEGCSRRETLQRSFAKLGSEKDVQQTENEPSGNLVFESIR